ncbi:helix-turn-helix transcriptional regulator [Halocatena marina]|uniref:helix-turn-helix transcriptional regulator n=1 Tax=Halocatena marina TaxID=2934937 RepID=UPI00200D90C3|nr:MarR family transcriptional regulator [Halocatena marina]
MLACMLVLSAGIVSAAQVDMSVDEYTLTGDSVLETEEDITYVTGWQSYSVEATVEGDPGAYQACLVMGDAVDEREIECKVVGVNASQSETVNFEKSEWPENMSGRQTVSLVVRDTNASDEPITTSSKQVNILGENGDYDGDGASNRVEIREGIEPRNDDTDGDGLSDGEELKLPTALPNKSDTDGDGLSDGIEVNKYDSSPNEIDTDKDGLNDRVEVNVHGTKPHKADSDNDGLLDKAELKEHGSDPTTKHSDDDGIPDQKEVNIWGTDPNDVDSDSDGLNDDVEVNGPTHPNVPDTDGDGLTDGEERNQYHTRPDKVDTDGDGVNDADEIKAGTDPNGQKLFLFSPMEYPMETAVTIIGAFLAIGIGGRYLWQRRNTPESTHQVESEIPPTVSNPTPIKNVNSDGEATETTVVNREPLTDEDRIQQLLDESGGRLHQSEIVSQTGWSKSKVSRLLSRMEEDGLISKISVGRENLIARSGDEPRHAGSAFED